jgi:multidrug efflux pump subunit AcrB
MHPFSKKKNIIQTTSYPLIMATIALMILGLVLSPLLKVKLLPDCSLPSVSVYPCSSGYTQQVTKADVDLQTAHISLGFAIQNAYHSCFIL